MDKGTRVTHKSGGCLGRIVSGRRKGYVRVRWSLTETYTWERWDSIQRS